MAVGDDLLPSVAVDDYAIITYPSHDLGYPLSRDQWIRARDAFWDDIALPETGDFTIVSPSSGWLAVLIPR